MSERVQPGKLRRYWKYGAVGVVALILGAGLGSSGSAKSAGVTVTEQAPTVTNTVQQAAQTVTQTQTVVKLKKVRPAGPAGQFAGDGTFLVPTQVKPGTYEAAAQGGCYWEVDKNLLDNIDSIIANDNTDGQAILTIPRYAKAVKTSNCSTFHRVS
jgi:hypothetical protein